MPTFIYKATSLKGEVRRGTQQAKNKHDLAQSLRKEGYVLTRAETAGIEKEREKKQKRLKELIIKYMPISLTAKMMFARHLSVMIGAGLPLTRALGVLEQQISSLRFKKTIRSLKESVTRGESLGDSLAKHPKIFSELFINMVKTAEVGGNLEETLNLLAVQLKKEYDLKSSIRSALFYPIVIIVAMLGIGIIMMIVVIPKLTETFREFKVDLPSSTKFVIWLSSFLMKWGLYVVPALAAAFFISKYVIKSKKSKKYLHWILLNLPVINTLVKKTNSAAFSRTLSSLIIAGTPIVKAINITSRTLTNRYYRESLIKIAEQVQKGKPLGGELSKYPNLYPPLVTQMTGVGEETGTLDDILKRLAEFYEQEVSTASKNLSTIIEPVLMILIGIIVGFFAVSMIQPMYSMMSGV